MNGIHDMGGMHGMGPVIRDENEPIFHEYWHGRVFALRMACAFHKKWNADMGRYARERMPPVEFLNATYYERGLYALETLLVESSLISRHELESGTAATKAPVTATLQPEAVAAIVKSRRKTKLDDNVAPRFKVGDKVLTSNSQPVGHTRLPRYARGRRGVIDRDHGVFTFADTNAMRRDKKPQHLYSVRFSATEIWGSDASPIDSIYLDLWDDYLEPI
jgi:nitrile hydratase subunit beta